MKSKKEPRIDDLVNRIGKLVKDVQKLAPSAAKLYSVEVDAILKTKNRDPVRIERCLDGMLDFCFDDEVRLLYKKLCRYYFDIDSAATVEYVHAYRDLWNEQRTGTVDEAM